LIGGTAINCNMPSENFSAPHNRLATALLHKISAC
jgi:hypothetical protein